MGYSSGKPVFGEKNHTYTTLDMEMDGNDVLHAKESWVPITLKRGVGTLHLSDGASITLPCIDVILCVTPIVRHYNTLIGGAPFSIYTGGWNTALTRSRMNEFLPKNWSVHNDKGFLWLSHHRGVYDWLSWPYAHHMTASGWQSVHGQRASEPAFKLLAGKRVPHYTVEEYIDRAFITLAWWHQSHDFYTKEKNSDDYWVRRWGPQVLRVLDEVVECMDDMRSADSPGELFASAMNTNHILHVSPGWDQDGRILKDYGGPRGISYAIVDEISTNGPEAYFGQEFIDDFLGKEVLPNMPEYITREEYNERKKSRKSESIN